ncbi:MAG TPA: thiamine-phosphate kinase [Saprospiraceae bacterium]|nr:thiamine-phosphate kinase [Saprospiraceae bacterium]MCC6687943.1 thiamine-phosphate kinase [Saprospiraceae bacterium]HMV23177.1 thiamine-phosphate kinase [Saprospiraceae bacterium]HMW75401.1 thiamine-phosphate kinase [Saprospiraceae bacterium]HMX83166.1 thiamine-phosphate kinase [Saprospiraceae bacterium]
MDSEVKRTEISTLGEFGLIDKLTKGKPLVQASSLTGIGDDAAVINHAGEPTVISTDILIEGIHFDLMYMPLKHLGYKAVAVNLSDIYAMNATPTQITVSIAFSNRFPIEAIEEIYEGIYSACKNYNVDLIGGDTSSSNKGLIISVTAIGTAKAGKLCYRNGAKPGDLICISGNLGAAYLGLQLLEREKQLFLENQNVQPDLEDQVYVVGRQLKPEPRFDIIETFEKAGLVPSAMIDISDGLVSEIFHICRQSGTGAYIEESGVPIHPDAEMLALRFNLDPITCALYGGEDYELLFTVDPKDLDKVKYIPDVYIAGEITEASDGIKLHTKGGNIHDLKDKGFNHFSA